jgi:hypothetical protein
VDAVDPAIVFDTTPCYSNLNFAIFRILLPRIMGLTDDDESKYTDQYVQIVRDKVFAPLGITDADCNAPSNGAYALAYSSPDPNLGHDFGDRRRTCGGEGWYLSVEDLGKLLLSLNGADGRILSELEFQDMEANLTQLVTLPIPAKPLGLHAVGWDCRVSGECGGPKPYRWLEKNGRLMSDGNEVNTSIAIFGGANTAPYVSGAVGVLFINSPGDAGGVLRQAFDLSLGVPFPISQMTPLERCKDACNKMTCAKGMLAKDCANARKECKAECK